MIVATNKAVACEPFTKKGVELKVVNGFAEVAHMSSLVGLKVIFGNDEIRPGDTIYVKRDGQKSWGKDEYEVGDQKVVICPPQFILLVDRKPLGVRPPPSITPPVQAF
jgi:hypothetical protein